MANEYLLPSERPEPASPTGTAAAKPAEQPYLLPSEQEDQAAAKEAARPSQNPLVAGWEATKEAAHGVWKGLGPAETPTEGPLESAQRIGGGLLSAAGLPFAPFVGAGKSIIAHATAPALRAAEYGIKKGVQQVKPDFDPKVQTHQEAYEALLPGAEAAISAIGPKRLPGGAVAPIAPVRKAPSGGLTTKAGQEVYAGKMLEQAASDPEAAIGALDAAKEIVPGSKPTTFQASGDLGLGQFERVVQNTPEGQAAFQQRWAEQNNARVNALRSLHEEGADPAAVSNHLRTAMQADDALAETELAAARARAEAADAQLGDNVSPEISGQVMRRELDDAHARVKAREREAWEAVDPNGTLLVNSGPVSNAQFRIYGDMTQAGAAAMTDGERTISGIIGQYPPTTSFREMRDLRSLVSSEMRNELFTRGQTPAYARLAQLRGAIEESVSRPVSMQTGQLAPEAAGRLQEASAATRQRAETFKQQPVAGALKREGAAGPYAVTNAAVPQRFIPSGPKGYDHVASYLRAVGNERGLPDVYDALVFDMRSRATNRDGRIDPNGLMRWAQSKQDALRAVTERDGGALVQRLQNVEGAEDAIATVAAQRNQLSVLHNEGIFGKLIGANNPTDVQNILGSVFGKQTSVTDAQAIMARLRASPEAQLGARQAIVDWIWDKFISNTAAGTTEENIIRADQFQQFIKLKEPTLRAFGFTPDQISTWQMISDDMRRTKQSIDATKMRGGPGTAQDLNAMYEMRERLGTSLFSKITWRLMAGSLGWAAEGPVGGAAAMLGAGVINSMRDRGIRSVQDLVKSAMMNPGVARRLLAKARGREVMPWMKTWMGYEAAAQQQPDQRQPQPQGFKRGGAVRPLGREGIQARNKARAVAARERSTLARQSAEAKRKVRRADGGAVPYATDSSEFKEEVAKALATSPDAIAAKQNFYPRMPLNDKAWDQFIQNAPASLNIEDRRPGYKGGLRAAHRLADGGEVNDDSSDPLNEELKRRNVPGGLNATAGPTVTSTTPVQDIPAPKVNAAGETLPTYVLKEMGKGLLGAPEKFTQAAGDLQRRGEYAGSHEDLPSFGPPPEEMPAGAQAALMLYGANAPFPKPGIGIFGGKGAKTANLDMLKQAQKMMDEGVPHETIRNRTGWERGPEGKWRFEISDAEARIKPEHPEDRIYEADAASRPTGFRPNQRLEQQMEHPAAYEAYPWLKDMRTSLDVNEKARPAAEFAPPTKNQKRFGKTGEISVNAPTYERGGVGDLFGEQKYSDVGARDMLLHEMQHAVQEAEGFAPGANPHALPMTKSDLTALTRRMAEKEHGVPFDMLNPKDQAALERRIRYRIYKAHAGETEARNVQTRADDTLRQRPSWATEDVARQHQVIENTKKERAAAGGRPFKDAKIYKSELAPEAEPVPGSKEWRDAPNPNAPFPQYAEQYPPVGPPKVKPKTDFKTGKPVYGPEGEQLTFEAKQQTPEAVAFMKERAKIIKDMDENGYHPYFDENQRFDVDPKNYPLNTDTINIVPKTLNKIAEHFYKIGAVETRKALRAAYSKGRLIGGGRGPDFVGPGGAGPEFVGPMQRLTTQDWYMMGQLEADLVRQMGPKKGREAFKEKFATSMAATTGGMKPRDNLIAGGYQNYLAAKGERWPEATHQWPSPVGSQYGSQLATTAQRIQDEGGFKGLGVGGQNPKRHNFAGDFMGHRKPGTMDEQMTDLMQPGKQQPDWYGLNEHIMAQEAEKAGADPRMYQETGWAGHKNAAGGPMIREVNHTIERIHRLTGMPRSEIVLRAWGKGDIPVYGVAGLAALKAYESQFTEE